MRISSVITHVGYAIGGAMIGGAFAAMVHPPGIIQFLSLAAAYAAYGYLLCALVIGPLRVLQGGRPILSDRRRRHLGIWCGIFSLFHVVAGLNVHFGGDMIQYFLVPTRSGQLSVRADAFGLTSELGLVATLGTALLLGVSNNASLRKMGALRWKQLQRISYPVFGLVVVHGIIFQFLEHRTMGLIVGVAAAASLVAVLQACAFKIRREASRPIIVR